MRSLSWLGAGPRRRLILSSRNARAQRGRHQVPSDHRRSGRDPGSAISCDLRHYSLGDHLPVQHRAAVVGTIDVESERIDAFTQDDVAFLERCAKKLLPLWIYP